MTESVLGLYSSVQARRLLTYYWEAAMGLYYTGPPPQRQTQRLAGWGGTKTPYLPSHGLQLMFKAYPVSTGQNLG